MTEIFSSFFLFFVCDVRFPLNMLPNVITALVEAWVCMYKRKGLCALILLSLQVSSGRLYTFLTSPELPPNAVTRDPRALQGSVDLWDSGGMEASEDDFPAIFIKNGNFSVRICCFVF